MLFLWGWGASSALLLIATPPFHIHTRARAYDALTPHAHTFTLFFCAGCAGDVSWCCSVCALFAPTVHACSLVLLYADASVDKEAGKKTKPKSAWLLFHRAGLCQSPPPPPSLLTDHSRHLTSHCSHPSPIVATCFALVLFVAVVALVLHCSDEGTEAPC